MADGTSAEDAATELADSDSRQRISRDRRKRQESTFVKALSSSTGQDVANDAHQHHQNHHHRHHRHHHYQHLHHHRSHQRHYHHCAGDVSIVSIVSNECTVNSDDGACLATMSATTDSNTVSSDDDERDDEDDDDYDDDREDDDDDDDEDDDDDDEDDVDEDDEKSAEPSVNYRDGAGDRMQVVVLGKEVQENSANHNSAVGASDMTISADGVEVDGKKVADSTRRVLRPLRPTSSIVVGMNKDGDHDDASARVKDEFGQIKVADDKVASNHVQQVTKTTAAAEGVADEAVNVVPRRHEGSPFKGQVRMAEDTLVGPYGKKRCADRYDSSESSDSGVAVSCGECSSSGTSDITEPGSPCSTSSDEGVAIRGASASPLPSLPKLAPSSQIVARPQWPWTPPLAATACSTYKRLKAEPEAGALPRSGAADPTSRAPAKNTANGKQPNGYHHHETQGKITEYFKTQIKPQIKSQLKPQQPKIKKTVTTTAATTTSTTSATTATSETMSVLVAKSSPEFRRPASVQRNKGGLAKFLGAVSPNARNTSSNEWETRNLAMSPPPVIVPRTNGKIDKKLPKPVPSLPISNDILKNLRNNKISSVRLSSDTSPSSPPSTGDSALTSESAALDFKGCILAKPHVNENNNLTNGCTGVLGSLRSQSSPDPLFRLSVPEKDKGKESSASPADEEDLEEEEEDSSRSSGSKPSLSPILSAPTTIRFPAQAPGKHRAQTGDSGICRWDKCDASFESSSGLLEHLQVAHINTQTGGDNFVCHWQGCKVHGRTSCSRRWLERHVLSHGGNKPFRCIVDGCGSRFSSQTALERHVNGHFNQPETSSSSGRRSCENGGKLVRRNGKRLRYRRQPWSARLFDYFDTGIMEGLEHRLRELAKSRTQGHLAETPGSCMALTSQVIGKRMEPDGKVKILLRWHPQDIEPDEWVAESEVQSIKYVDIRKAALRHPEEVSLALYPAFSSDPPPSTRVKQRRKPPKNS